MNARTFAAAVAALSVVWIPVHAQQTPTPRMAPQAQRVEVPSAGLMLNFAEIDRNGDRSISVEEWNAFVAGLQARTARSDADSQQSAAGGGTRAPEARPLAQPKR